MLVVLKERAHGVDKCPTRLRNSIALILIGTWDSWSALLRISLYTGLVRRRSKMEIWADMFPRCSMILYCALGGAGTGGRTILNLVCRVVTAHSLFGPWILITLTEGFISDTHPIKFP